MSTLKIEMQKENEETKLIKLFTEIAVSDLSTL